MSTDERLDALEKRVATLERGSDRSIQVGLNTDARAELRETRLVMMERAGEMRETRLMSVEGGLADHENTTAGLDDCHPE